MSLVESLLLGIIQGLTEFIPVSSSAHLVIIPWIFGWSKPDLVFDTTVHWGTLLAVVAYFRNDIRKLATALIRSIVRRSTTEPEARLAWLVLVGTIPAVVMGALWQDFFEGLFSSPSTVAALLLITGTFLALSEWLAMRQRNLDGLLLPHAVLIGIAQGLAIAPGISRSGATIGMGLLLGIKREASARYSFLLAIPIIFGAGSLKLKDLLYSGDLTTQAMPLVVGFVSASIVGYFCIKFLISYLRKGHLYIFSAYCWLLGIATLILALGIGR